MKRIALIADLVSSKKIKNRADVQKKLNAIFRKLNKQPGILSPYTITLGDEFQAVFNNAHSIFKDMWQIIYAIYPVRIRFSIGIGELTTKVNHKSAIGMDGPAFYNARKGIEELKNSAYYININSDDEESIRLIKQTLYLISFYTKGWKDNRIKILNLMYEGLLPKQISERMDVTDKAVYKNITTGALYVVLNLTNEITVSINDIIRKK